MVSLWVDPMVHAAECARFRSRAAVRSSNRQSVGVRPARRGALRSRRRSAVGLAEVSAVGHAATGWVAVAARDEAHYLEARIAKPPQRGDGIGPIHAGAALRCRCPLLPLGR